MSKAKQRLGVIAFLKAKKLEKTTVGEILEEIQTINNKMDAISEILGITFSQKGTLLSEGYTEHKHSYVDTTIPDTADGTGVLQSSTTETGAVLSI